MAGADFSAGAIAAARALASEIDLAATFVHSNRYELPQHLAGQCDIVFTSHGVLNWLPDLAGWAQVIAHFLKPGGLCFIIEAHPVVHTFDNERQDAELRLRYPYFPQPAPLQEEEQGSYAVPDAPVESVAYYRRFSQRQIGSQFYSCCAAFLTEYGGVGFRFVSAFPSRGLGTHQAYFRDNPAFSTAFQQPA